MKRGWIKPGREIGRDIVKRDNGERLPQPNTNTRWEGRKDAEAGRLEKGNIGDETFKTDLW